MNAANDTSEPTTIERGCTVESATWRAHRFADHIEVTSLVNAGKRGKACDVFRVSAPYYIPDARNGMAEIAPSILAAVQQCLSVAAMRAMLAGMPSVDERLTFSEHTKRGIDVPRGSQIDVQSDLVDVRFTETEMWGKISWWFDKPGGLKHDELFSVRTRQDAAKAYAWAKDPQNRARLVNMNLSTFRAEMTKIGVRLN